MVLVLSALLLSCGGGGDENPTSTPAAAYSYPLTVAPTARHMFDQSARPFLLVGDAAWSLIAAVSNEDANLYLENRKQHGFTGILVNLLEKGFGPNVPANFYGVTAFAEKPFTTPREEYFAHADTILKMAADKGLAVFLFPVFLGFECGSDDGGWCAEVKNASVADMRAWGEFLGNRYANYQNIVWVIGGDTDPSPVKSKLEAMIDGIRSKDTQHPFTVHNQRGVMAVTPWPGADWLTINSTYTEGIDYEQAQNAYRIAPAKPFFLIESQYENVKARDAQAIRAQAYWTVLSGGFGHIFGNCPVWGFGFGGDCPPLTDWRAQLDSPGSVSMQHFGALFHSRHWGSLVPDTAQTVLMAGIGTFGNTDYALAACTADGTSIIAYLPSPRAITVNGACLTGSAMIAWWYNPSTGAATQIGTFPTNTPQQFTPPASGDWVLVLDSSGTPFPAPGM
jgi:hypothetical protein